VRLVGGWENREKSWDKTVDVACEPYRYSRAECLASLGRIADFVPVDHNTRVKQCGVQSGGGV
jgi:hypothetical protein